MGNVNMNEIKIDNELRDLLPPLTNEEFEQLENSILTNGLLDGIKVWENPDTNEKILIDGHNRYNICKRNNIEIPDDKIQFLYKDEFENRNEVINWMIDFQLGRRNLTDGQVSYFRGLQYSKDKGKQGTNNQYIQSEKGQNVPFQTIAEKLAKQYNVSEKTIKRNEQFAKAVDAIAQSIGVEAKNKILKEEIIISKEDVIKLSTMDAETQKKYLIDNEDKKVKLPKVKVMEDEPEENIESNVKADDIPVDPIEEEEEEIIIPVVEVIIEPEIILSDMDKREAKREAMKARIRRNNAEQDDMYLELTDDLFDNPEQREEMTKLFEESKQKGMKNKNKCDGLGWVGKPKNKAGQGRPPKSLNKPKDDKKLDDIDTTAQEENI